MTAIASNDLAAPIGPRDRLIVVLHRNRHRRRARRRLSSLSDHLLRDIGLRRADLLP